MMNHTLKSLCSVQAGTVVEGKWHKKKYTILKELGNGANGIVYLASYKGEYVALKMSDNSLSITSEVNVLKSFAKVQGSALGPSLMDVDDWPGRQGFISFYVMEYIIGEDFLSFIEKRGKSWVIVLILQLLNDLEQMHQNGWVFGDLKPENLLVAGSPTRIRCIDVGGTTIRGRAIKEFTEYFDRGYWGLGSRKAEPTYDLFAVGMILINTAYPKRFQKREGGMEQLLRLIHEKPELHKLQPVIVKALQGKFTSAHLMREELLDLVTGPRRAGEPEKIKDSNQKRNHRQTSTVTRQTQLRTQRYTGKSKKKKKSGFVETLLILAVMGVFYFLYLSGKLF